MFRQNNAILRERLYFLVEDGIVLPKHVGAIVNKEVHNFGAFS
jgi:hypothetical protein